MRKLTNGQKLKQLERGELSLAKAKLWRYQSWLGSAEAGQDGNLLADSIGDVVSVLDTEHPEALKLKKNSEKGDWVGWVSELDAFEEEPKSETEEKTLVTKEESGGASSESSEEPAKASESGFLLKRATIETVFWKWSTTAEKNQDGSSRAKLFQPEPINVMMEARTKDKDGAFAIQIEESNGKAFKVQSLVSQPIIEALKARHNALPKNGEIVFHIGPGKSYPIYRNGGNLTGSGFILADAAITGKKPDALVIAALGEDGELSLPKDVWRLLMALKAETGRKIVLPVEAEEYLVGLLTMGKLDFFLKNEVLMASSDDEFIALCAQEAGDEIIAVRKNFAEIREKSEGKEVGAYLANRFVRQRLEDMSEGGSISYFREVTGDAGSRAEATHIDEKGPSLRDLENHYPGLGRD